MAYIQVFKIGDKVETSFGVGEVLDFHCGVNQYKIYILGTHIYEWFAFDELTEVK